MALEIIRPPTNNELMELEEAEQDDTGLSNDVYLTEDEVIKAYSWFPLTSALASLASIPSGPELFTRSKRIEKEKASVPVLNNTSIKAPEILEHEDNKLIYVRVHGPSVFERLNEIQGSEATELGSRLKQGVDELHSSGFALRDARLTNFIISGEDIYSIDHEYSDLNSNRISEFLDWLTIVSSARQTQNYKPFVKGLKPPKTAAALSLVTALAHAVILERSKTRIVNTLRSLT